MKDYIENNTHIVNELLKIDNKIMNDKLAIDTLLKHASNTSDLCLNNSLIFYDGNPLITIKLINSNVENCILYPSNAYIAINKFIISYKSTNHLSIEQNDFKYEKVKNIFENIIVLNDKILYEELKVSYPTINYIEI